MNKLYTKVGWKNEPDKTTPINETNLGKMDNGINDLDDRVIELNNNKANSEDVINSLLTTANALKQYDETGYTIDYRGYGEPSQYYPPSATYSGKKYLDQNTGRMYDCMQQGSTTYVWRQAPVMLTLITSKKANASTTLSGYGITDAYTKTETDRELASAKSVSGSTITLSDASATNLQECVVELEAVQSGSGEPSPSNVRAISGFDKVEVTRDGKNHFDASAITSGYRIGSDGEPYQASTYCLSDWIKVKPSTEYVRNVAIQQSSTSLALYDKNKHFIERVASSNGTFTTTATTAYIRSAILLTDKDTCQIEEGTTATTYEPYQGKTYTIQLGDTLYGAEIDFVRGVARVKRGIKDLGDLEYMYSAQYTVFYANIDDAKYDGFASLNGTANCICSCFTRNTDSWLTFSNGDFSVGADTKGNEKPCITIVDTRYNNVTAFTTAVTGQKVVYELATPYTIKLNPTQIKLLKNNNTLYANSGDMSIKYQPDNALGKALEETEIGYDAQIEYIKNSLIPSRERNDITSRLQLLPQAVSEQNLGKYGYKIGDYFTGASGYTYIIADYNTFKGISTPYCLATNHIGIVVDTHTTSQWYSGDASSVGYNGSTLHTYLKGTVMDNIKVDMIALFGGSTGLEHLIAHSKLYTTALANWAWQANQYISALSEVQTIGSVVWGANGYQTGEASKKLELFDKYKWTEIFGGEYSWLRDMQSASYACLLYADGSAYYVSVTGAYCVVGLINFY